MKDVAEALDYTVRGLVHPIITKGTLADVDKFLNLMKDGKLQGRAVLKVSDTSKQLSTPAAPAIKNPQIATNFEDRLFINGQYVPSKDNKTFDIINPATEKLAATIYEAGVDDVDLAVKAAKAAFPAWNDLGALERSSYLFKLADAMDKHADELDYLDAICMGKPIGNCTFFAIAKMTRSG